jgi:hypothetical protein
MSHHFVIVGKTVRVCKGTNCKRHVNIFLMDQKIPVIVSFIYGMLHVWSMDCTHVAHALGAFKRRI